MNPKEGKLHIGAVFCAGGAGRRFGENKLLADALGEPVLKRTMEGVLPVLRERCAATLLVTRHAACAAIGDALGVRSIVKDLPEKSDTVRTAVRALGNCDAILFLQGDQMLLTGKSAARLIEAYQKAPEKPARLSYENTPGSPVIFPASYFPKLLALSGDRGGSALLKNAQVTLVPAGAQRELWDLDTREDLQRMCRVLKNLLQNPE